MALDPEGSLRFKSDLRLNPQKDLPWDFGYKETHRGCQKEEAGSHFCSPGDIVFFNLGLVVRVFGRF